MDATTGKLNCLGLTCAFGYFYYLKKNTFKKLRHRIRNLEDNYKNEITISPKCVYILVPQQVRFCDFKNLEDLTKVDDLEEIVKDFAGIQNRIYGLTAFKLHTTQQFILLEMAQCLDVYTRLRSAYPSTPNQRQAIVEQFINVLSYLLYSDKSFKDYKILTFNDGERFSEIWQRPSINLAKVKPDISIANLGKCLAYWFYYNNLNLWIPELLENIKLWEEKHRIECVGKKVFIIVPHSCYCPNDISEVDDNLEYATDLPDTPKEIGASANRRYQKSVWHIKNSNKKMFFIAEYAAPIAQLYRMYHESQHLFKSDEKSMDAQRHDFVLQLRTLLRKDNNDKVYEILTPRDDDPNFRLSNFLFQKVR